MSDVGRLVAAGDDLEAIARELDRDAGVDEQTPGGLFVARPDEAQGHPIVDLLLHQGGAFHLIGPEAGDMVRIAQQLHAFLADESKTLWVFREPIHGELYVITRKGAESVLGVVRGWATKVRPVAMKRSPIETPADFLNRSARRRLEREH